MDNIRLREFQQYQYKDPRAWLRELCEIELLIRDKHMDDRVRTLRTHKLHKWRERRMAALFAFALAERMPGASFDFAGVERSDYDAVIRCWSHGARTFLPVQFKEFVPESLNEEGTVEEILRSLGKYSDSSDLVAVVFLNRRMRIRLHPIPPKKIKLSRLYFLGAASPDRSQWILMGDLLRSTKVSKFTHPRALREEIADITFPPSPGL